MSRFDSFSLYIRGLISGSTEIFPRGQGGVTFQEIAIVFLQPAFGPRFLIIFLEILTWV